VRVATAVVTVPRLEGYIHQTIRSFEETGYFDCPEVHPLRLVVGALDASHLAPYRDRPDHFVIDELNHEDASRIGFQLLGVKPRCAFGHYRAMKGLLALEESWEAALICEDDIRFAKGWRKYLDRIVEEVKERFGNRWMVTMYRLDHCLQTGVSTQYRQGHKWLRLPAEEQFWGAQAILYSREALAVFPDCLLKNCIRKFVQPNDITIGQFAALHGIPIIATAPSLVQHIGGKTTGQSEWFHQAECFMESVEEGD
jgi:hypothetical protein